MGKILIAHDFNLKLKMFSLDKKLIDKKIIKKYLISDINKINKKNYANIKIFWGNRLNKNQINKMSELRYVHFGSKGVNEEISSILKKKNIRFTVTNKIFIEPMIATIFGYIFSISRGLNLSFILRQNDKFDRKNFDKLSGNINNVFGERFLIVGYGEIAKALIKKLKFITKDIHIINRSKIKLKNYKFIKGLKNLNEAVKNKKFIINTLPLTNETKNIFNNNVFKNFSKNSFFINIGRGDTVNYIDFKKFLQKNKSISVALDVYQQQFYQNPYSPVSKKFTLLNAYNHILTPHVSSYDNNYWEKQINIFQKNLQKYDKYLKKD